MLNTKISAKGGPVFIFSLPGMATRPLIPPSVTRLTLGKVLDSTHLS